MTTVVPLRRLDVHRGVEVVTLPARLDVHALGPLAAALERVDTERSLEVSLDGSLVEHVDRAGLRFLVELGRTLRLDGVVLTITNASLALRLAAELTRTRDLPPLRSEDVLVELAEAA